MKNSKIIAIIALVVGVVGLAIGFAAFSNTLTISSSASVKPDSSTFKVEFSTASGSSSTTLATSNYNVKGGATLTAGNVSITGTKISGLNASFTAPGQSVSYTFYARNIGEYTAYLNKFEGGEITCTPGKDTTASLVQDACSGIQYNLDVTRQSDGIVLGLLSGNGSESPSGTASGYLTAGDYASVTISIGYAEGSARADGDFSVAIGDVELLFESVD